MANLNLNKTILGGKIATNLELQKTPSDVSVCSFTVAVSRKAKREETDFIKCVAWRNMAEFICKYFHKGSSICIVGNIQTRSWTDQDSNKRYATEVVVEDTMFVDNKADNTADTPPSLDVPPEFEISEEPMLPF